MALWNTELSPIIGKLTSSECQTLGKFPKKIGAVKTWSGKRIESLKRVFGGEWEEMRIDDDCPDPFLGEKAVVSSPFFE